MVKRLVAIALFSGCMSYYSDGPAWSPPAPRPDGGYVVVYRPAKQWGQLQNIEVEYKTRTCSLYANAFCVFYFPAGEHALMIGVPVLAEVGVGVGVTWSKTSYNPAGWKRLDVTIAPGQTVFVRTEFDRGSKPPIAEIVPAPELGDVRLAPGGLPRDPVADVP